jgi:hypothetical protein
VCGHPARLSPRLYARKGGVINTGHADDVAGTNVEPQQPVTDVENDAVSDFSGGTVGAHANWWMAIKIGTQNNIDLCIWEVMDMDHRKSRITHGQKARVRVLVCHCPQG